MIIMTTDAFEAKEQDHDAVGYKDKECSHDRGCRFNTCSLSEAEHTVKHIVKERQTGESSDPMKHLWIKTESNPDRWTIIEDEPSPKRMCVRRENDGAGIPGKDSYQGQRCSRNQGNRDVASWICTDRSRHTPTDLDEQQQNGDHPQRSYSPPPIHIKVNEIKQHIGSTSESNFINGERHPKTYCGHRYFKSASVPPKKRHSDGIMAAGHESNDARHSRRSCSDMDNLQKDERLQYRLNTLQKNLIEALYKTCYDLSKKGTETREFESHRKAPPLSPVQCTENNNLGDKPKGGNPAFMELSTATENSNQSVNTYQEQNLDVFEMDIGNPQNIKQCTPSVVPVKDLSPLSCSTDVSPYQGYQGMPGSPNKVKSKTLSPQKVLDVSSTCCSPSASSRDLKAESAHNWQQKTTEADSNGTAMTIREELINLQSRYRQTFQPGLQWAEKEFSVKELRHLIPILILETFDLKSDPVTKKVKGIWDKAPVGWPSSVPYIDPNNGQKPTGKPKKDVLLKMFCFLLHQYIQKLEEEGFDMSPYDAPAQSNIAQALPLPFVPRTGSTLASPGSQSSDTGSSFSLPYEEPRHSAKTPVDIQHDVEGNKLSPHSPNIGSTNMAHHNNPMPPVKTVELSPKGTNEISPKMPSLIPICEILQPINKHKNSIICSDSDTDGVVDCKTQVTSCNGVTKYSQHVEENNDHVKDADLVSSTVQSLSAKALTFEKSSTLKQCDPNSKPMRSPNKKNVCVIEMSSSANGQSMQQLQKSTEQEAKVSSVSPTSPFRGMKARILEACLSEVSKVNCDTTSTSPTSDVSCHTEDKQSPLREKSAEQSHNLKNSCPLESAPTGRSICSSKHTTGSDCKIKTPNSDDVTISCVPDAGSPVVALYSRVKEKVYYIHWAGWLAEGDVRLLYSVFDQLKGLKQMASECERSEELFIESSHLLESVLDLVMLRKTIKSTHTAILTQLNKHIYKTIDFIHI